MGWAHCGEDAYGREMGYSVVAKCDQKGCRRRIDRGLAYVCGGMHKGGEYGCGGYFCEKHRFAPDRRKVYGGLCKRCLRRSGSGLGHWLSRLPIPKTTGRPQALPRSEETQDRPADYLHGRKASTDA